MNPTSPPQPTGQMWIKAVEGYEEKLGTWFKSLLAISSAALAVLVSLMPTEQVSGIARIALLVCWVALAVTILFALLASYRSVHKAGMELAIISKLMLQNDPKAQEKSTQMITRGKQLSPLLSFSQWVSVVGFGVSFVSLAVFACAQTL